MVVALLGAAVLSCDRIQSIIHDGEVVARVGKHKLYSSELNAYIPNGISAEDSTKLALQYINTWASDLLFLDVAESELSKEEKDVSVELEDYRRSLLKYRYEQNFVNQRLDTAITAAQIERYYDSHKDNFQLTVPIVKARFLNISSDSPSLSVLKAKMSSEDPEDLAEADSIAYSAAMRYTDYGGGWVDAVTLSREFGKDYGQLLSSKKKGFIEEDDGKGNLCKEKFDALLTAYKKHISLDDVDWSAVLDAGFSSMLSWLSYNVKRALGIEISDESERKEGIRQVQVTIEELYNYQKKMKCLKEWLEHDGSYNRV